MWFHDWLSWPLLPGTKIFTSEKVEIGKRLGQGIIPSSPWSHILLSNIAAHAYWRDRENTETSTYRKQDSGCLQVPTINNIYLLFDCPEREPRYKTDSNLSARMKDHGTRSFVLHRRDTMIHWLSPRNACFRSMPSSSLSLQLPLLMPRH